MKRRAAVWVLAAVLAGCAGTDGARSPRPGAGAGGDPPAGAPARTPEAARLETTPRHHEWADVRHGARTVRAFLVFPEVERPAPAVLVLHENKGLTDWVRSVADRLGEEGFVAIAPDLLSGTAPGGAGTEGYPSQDAATAAISKLPPEQVTADLHAVANHVRTLPGCDGTVSVVGFCWGGAQAFRFATSRHDLAAAHVFYGTAPDDEGALAAIRAPVHGYYGANDARVNATLPKTEERMRRLGKTFDPVVYPGAGHGFLRAGATAPAGDANRAAHDAAWARLLGLLRR